MSATAMSCFQSTKLSVIVPVRAHSRKTLHPLERNLPGFWFNRSADSTGYRNQFFITYEIDIEKKIGIVTIWEHLHHIQQ